MPTTNRMKIQFDASHLMMASSCRCFAVVDSIIGAGIGSAIRGGHGCACGQPASRPAGAPADAVHGYGLPAGAIVSWRGDGPRGEPHFLRVATLAPSCTPQAILDPDVAPQHLRVWYEQKMRV